MHDPSKNRRGVNWKFALMCLLFLTFVGVQSHYSNTASPHLSASWHFTHSAEKTVFQILSPNEECSPLKNYHDLSTAWLYPLASFIHCSIAMSTAVSSPKKLSRQEKGNWVLKILSLTLNPEQITKNLTLLFNVL